MEGCYCYCHAGHHCDHFCNRLLSLLGYASILCFYQTVGLCCFILTVHYYIALLGQHVSMLEKCCLSLFIVKLIN